MNKDRLLKKVLSKLKNNTKSRINNFINKNVNRFYQEISQESLDISRSDLDDLVPSPWQVDYNRYDSKLHICLSFDPLYPSYEDVVDQIAIKEKVSIDSIKENFKEKTFYSLVSDEAQSQMEYLKDWFEEEGFTFYSNGDSQRSYVGFDFDTEMLTISKNKLVSYLIKIDVDKLIKTLKDRYVDMENSVDFIMSEDLPVSDDNIFEAIIGHTITGTDLVAMYEFKKEFLDKMSRMSKNIKIIEKDLEKPELFVDTIVANEMHK